MVFAECRSVYHAGSSTYEPQKDKLKFPLPRERCEQSTCWHQTRNCAAPKNGPHFSKLSPNHLAFILIGLTPPPCSRHGSASMRNKWRGWGNHDRIRNGLIAQPTLAHRAVVAYRNARRRGSRPIRRQPSREDVALRPLHDASIVVSCSNCVWHRPRGGSRNRLAQPRPGISRSR